MPRKLVLLLDDVLHYAAIARRLNANATYLAYANDEKLRLATERCLFIVGEALSQALQQRLSLLLEISDVRKIIAFRHRLAHGYTEIADPLVWSFLQQRLGELEAEVFALREKMEDEVKTDER